jgi:hypothetical protein
MSLEALQKAITIVKSASPLQKLLEANQLKDSASRIRQAIRDDKELYRLKNDLNNTKKSLMAALLEVEALEKAVKAEEDIHRKQIAEIHSDMIKRRRRKQIIGKANARGSRDDMVDWHDVFRAIHKRATNKSNPMKVAAAVSEVIAFQNRKEMRITSKPDSVERRYRLWKRRHRPKSA